jgi:pimeloyl-ACP methyl ester carboxylesterase
MIRALLFVFMLFTSVNTARAETVWFRGLFGMVFSTGIIQMAGDDPHYCWCQRRTVQKEIIRRWITGALHEPIDIVGHSLGADQAQQLAIELRKAGVPVGTVILLDATVRYDLTGFDAYNFMSRDFRAKQVKGALTIPMFRLRHVPLPLDKEVQARVKVLLG